MRTLTALTLAAGLSALEEWADCRGGQQHMSNSDVNSNISASDRGLRNPAPPP